MSPRLAALLALAFLSSAQAAEKLTVSLATEPLLQSRLNAGLVPYKEREQTIVNLFTEAGCKVDLQPVTRKANNVICTLPGATDPQPILVGAHLDFVDKGQGIIDDWTGTSMLVSLYQALKSVPRKHTFIFIAFAKEEDGLVGSTKFVSVLDRPQRSAIRAFVNLECLGTGPTKLWIHRSTPELIDDIAYVADLLKIPVSGVDVDRVGDDDTHPFKDARIPVITIHSITQETWPYLHSKRDRMDAIHLQNYAESYRLVAFFLAYLDSNVLKPAA